MKRINKKKLIAIVACAAFAVPIAVIPLSTVVVYETIFSSRFETQGGLELSVNDFNGLTVENVTFESSVNLAGYKYSKNIEDPKGVVIISHGLGGGGHNKFMPYIDALTSQGYLVFSYDAQGNDKSEGDDTGGFPQGIIDLDNAIKYVQRAEEYKNLPIMLFGHSWGAYSVGSVLNLHPEVSAAVMVAGFDESEELLSYYPKKVIGSATDLLLPYVTLYEKLKFGSDYTDITVTNGIISTKANVLIAHSKDDNTVPYECGYEKYYKEFSNEQRVSFVSYEQRGHSDLLYSNEAVEYQNQIKENYEIYLKSKGEKATDENKKVFLQANCDPVRYYEPSPELLNEILKLFNSSI